MFPVQYATIKDCYVIINGDKPIALQQNRRSTKSVIENLFIATESSQFIF